MLSSQEEEKIQQEIKSKDHKHHGPGMGNVGDIFYGSKAGL